MPTPDLAAIELIGCYTSEFSIQGRKSIQQLLTQSEEYYVRLHQTSQVGLDLGQNHAGIKLLIEVELLANDLNSPVDLCGRFEMYFNFEVTNLKDLSVAHPADEITMPTFELAVMLAGISHSTARGILMARLAGTPLDGFSLPLTDASELVIEGRITTTTKLRS